MIATAPIVIVVQRTLPSQNVTDRMHWRGRYAETKSWEILIRAAVPRLPIRPAGKVRVEITSMRARLITDEANLRGGAKYAVDALVRLGFLHDDSDDYAHIRYRQVQAPKAIRCTRIVIEAA